MINILESIAKVCEMSHLSMIEESFGDTGVSALFRVMAVIKDFYAHVDPERIKGHIVVVHPVFANGDAARSLENFPISFPNYSNTDIEDLSFEILENGSVCLRTINIDDLESLSKSALIYHYHKSQEEFLAGSKRQQVPRLDASSHSQFSVPTFATLREALSNYASENIRESTCYIFNDVWEESNRIFLKNKPEHVMRSSLTQFLRNRMGGDHDVWPEQNVNEKNPVDIRVQARLSNNRLMLIEIKWLGDSITLKGDEITSYRDSRAQEGADQLVGYIDEQKRFAPTRVIQGYYVVIDARRRNVKMSMTEISRANGLYYEDKELKLDLTHHDGRNDFDPPYRMFVRPICSL